MNSLLEELRGCNALACGSTCKRSESSAACQGLVVEAADVLQEYVDRCKRYADEIMALREQPRWISVTERLPIEGERVLAATEGVFSGEAYLSCEGVWMRSYGVVWVSLVDMPVTHWMPLPYKPEVTCDG